MKLHEYQAKEIFKRYGIPVQEGSVASTAREAVAVAEELGGSMFVVKAQILAGGRGKAGGVKLCRSIEEVERAASELLGKRLITHQTGPKGAPVNRVLVARALDIEREFYFAITTDRAKASIVAMASSEGGVEIEEVARRSPEKIFKAHFRPGFGLMRFQARRLAAALNLTGSLAGKATEIFVAAARIFLERDASLVEMNPLVLTPQGELVALDAKINIDDNALFRQPELASWRDTAEDDPHEIEARKYGLSYIKLSGSIGCLVNGAGLAMATMDTIKLFGAEPANFLDVGGGADVESVSAAFRILLSDSDVKAVLVNIFGGIMRCDTIARGMVEALSGVELKVPIVVRLAGTNVDEGKKILAASGINFIAADSIADAAKKAVEAANQNANA